MLGLEVGFNIFLIQAQSKLKEGLMMLVLGAHDIKQILRSSEVK